MEQLYIDINECSIAECLHMYYKVPLTSSNILTGQVARTLSEIIFMGVVEGKADKMREELAKMIIRLKAKGTEAQQIYECILTYFAQEVRECFYTDLTLLNNICQFIGVLVYQNKLSFLSVVKQFSQRFSFSDRMLLYQIIV